MGKLDWEKARGRESTGLVIDEYRGPRLMSFREACFALGLQPDVEGDRRRFFNLVSSGRIVEWKQPGGGQLPPPKKRYFVESSVLEMARALGA